MILYHRTFTENIFKILECGYIDNMSKNISQDTIVINKALEMIIGKNIRENAIYFDLSNHIPAFKSRISVDINNLNSDKLFVGNYRDANELLEYLFVYMDGDFDNEEIAIQNCIISAKRYHESFVPYEEYKNNREHYSEDYDPEFLYFDKINKEYINISN